MYPQLGADPSQPFTPTYQTPTYQVPTAVKYSWVVWALGGAAILALTIIATKK